MIKKRLSPKCTKLKQSSTKYIQRGGDTFQGKESIALFCYIFVNNRDKTDILNTIKKRGAIIQRPALKESIAISYKKENFCRDLFTQCCNYCDKMIIFATYNQKK